MDRQTDAELLRVAGDDDGAFVTLVGRHMGALGRYASRRLGPDRAPNIVNETFAVAFSRRGGYDDAHPDAGPWLFGIATNLIHRERRREARQLRAYARSGVDPVAEDAPHTDIDPVLAGVLAGLRAEHRDVLFLHAVAGLSHDEIAPGRSSQGRVGHHDGAARRPPRGCEP